MKWLYYISFFCISIGLFQILVCLLFTFKTKKAKRKKEEKDANFCILIPARNESAVIEKLLISITKQTYAINPASVYVIVEDFNDPTVNICQKYQTNVYVRTQIEGRKRKGYALDEALKHIKKKYDAYIIIDADNILDPNFLMKMNETYQQGYDIVAGYRNCKNGNQSVIAASSALTFSMINTLSNKVRSKRHKNIIVSGTGFCIRGKWIQKWNGYPFHSLTEDYELSLYAILYNMTSIYNEEAIFFDEQPTTYKETVKQRIRWIRGYFDSRKEYVPKFKKARFKKHSHAPSLYQATVGVKPYIWIIIGIMIALLKEIGMFFYFCFQSKKSFLINIKWLGVLLLIIYGILLLFTLLLLILEGRKINLSKSMKIKVLFFHPIFLITYIPCALKAVLKKEVRWDEVKHKSNQIE